MGPKKSVSDSSNDASYPEVLHKLCKEEDVLVIPQFVTYRMGRYSELISPRKSKDSRLADKFASTSGQLTLSVKGEFEDCESIRPPQVGVIYEAVEDNENPVTVICKNIYIEYSLVHAVGKSLIPFPTINSLKIENCCISKEIAEALASLLAVEPGRQISDLSLDGNANIAEVLPLFISLSTGVRYLSLQKCGLDDEAVKIFVQPLGYSGEKTHKLQFLNLGMNKITDSGVVYLANALRTNRTLISLSLAGNQIGDEGVLHLIEVLQRFRLTQEETVLKRRRIYDQIIKRKNATEKYLEEWKMKGEVESQTSKISTKSIDRFNNVKKIRGIDGKIRCLSSRDKKAKTGLAKLNSGEKFRGKNRNEMEERQNNLDPTPSELLAIAQQVDSEIPPDKHPFVNEVFKSDGELWCDGCWSIGNVNLSYNYLTEKSVTNFITVIDYQTENFRAPKLGLLRLVLLPGNYIRESSDEFKILQKAIVTKNNYSKELLEIPVSVPAGPVPSARRMSSPTKKKKDR